jgi:hypothetical protein
LDTKIPVNLENYPALLELAGEDKEGFLQLLKSLFNTANDAVQAGHHKVSREYFGMEYQDLLRELMAAMFDYKGIMDYMPGPNREAISDMYKYAVNPLYAAFTKDDGMLLDAKGKPITFEEKFGQGEEEFTVKAWLQGLLFYSYYCSLPDFAQYLAINDFSLVDNEKHKNIAKLMEVRPVLNYQQAKGILPGKLIPETGFFDAGETFPGTEICPACKSVDKMIEVTEELTVCCECKAGYTNN